MLGAIRVSIDDVLNPAQLTGKGGSSLSLASKECASELELARNATGWIRRGVKNPRQAGSAGRYRIWTAYLTLENCVSFPEGEKTMSPMSMPHSTDSSCAFLMSPLRRLE